MRRGQSAADRIDPAHGFTKQELIDAGGISPKVFDAIRKAARVRGPTHGGLNWVFPPESVAAMIHRAESGPFTERGSLAAVEWRKLLVERGHDVPPRPRH